MNLAVLKQELSMLGVHYNYDGINVCSHSSIFFSYIIKYVCVCVYTTMILHQSENSQEMQYCSRPFPGNRVCLRLEDGKQ